MADTLLAITQSIPTVQDSPESTWKEAAPVESVKEEVDDVLYLSDIPVSPLMPVGPV